MKLNPINMKDIMDQTGFGKGIDGTIVFSSLGKIEMENMPFQQFVEAEKTNYQSEFGITRSGNPDDDIPLQVDICKTVDLPGFKLENIPLDGVDLTEYSDNKYSKGQTTDQIDNLHQTLKLLNPNRSIELDRGNDEGFLGEFFTGSMTITPSKTKYPEDHSKFNTPQNENVEFDLKIKGCQLVYHTDSPNESYEANLNHVSTFFTATVVPEVNLHAWNHRATKESAKLQHSVFEVTRGMKTKLPAQLFHQFSYNDFKNHYPTEKKNLYIASLKDNAIYQIND